MWANKNKRDDGEQEQNLWVVEEAGEADRLMNEQVDDDDDDMKKRVGIERNPLGFTKDLRILDAVGVFRNPSFPFLVALGNWVYITFQRSFFSFRRDHLLRCN